MQQGLQQGIERGIERGIQQGLREGELRQLVVVLTKRFGQLPQRLRSSLERLGTEQLEALMDVALSATTLDEFAAAVPSTSPGG
jgi:flagellar biosynthesis/type III secretory pathway protein FliH